MRHQVLAVLGAAALLAGLAACSTGGDAVDAGRTEAAQAPVPTPSPPPQPAAEMARAAPPVSGALPPPQPVPGDVDRERYEDVDPNPVKRVSEAPVSTFSIDVDTASYANVRRFLNDGILPPRDAVRIEELINYFDYAYPLPDRGEAPFATHVSLVPSPWADGRKLMQVGIQGYDLEPDARPPLNLTLLVDVSGSMAAEDKLPLARKALAMLVDRLGPDDRISIVAYAGAAGEVLPPTPGDETRKILSAMEQMSAGGSTAGGEGLRLAYSLAEQGYREGGVNRVMLLTDGDFNVGIADPERLEDFVARKRETGIYLSVLGFGRGNYNDAMMQKIAQAGNGMASYVDTLNEARKILNDDLTGNLFPIADDVKIQVEFNPARVAEYRLIGYETRQLDRADFNNDAVDAGEIGAGASVTALYEIAETDSEGQLIDPPRYGAQPDMAADERMQEFAFFRLRYKLPGSDTSTLIERPVVSADEVASLDEAPDRVRFATAVAAYGQLLRGDPYLSDTFGWDDVIALAQGARGDDPYGYRAEFVTLARLAKSAQAQETLRQPGDGRPD